MQRPLGCEIHPPLSMQIWDSGIVQVVRWGEEGRICLDLKSHF